MNFISIFLFFASVAYGVEKKWTVFAVVNGDNFNEMTDEVTLQSKPVAPMVFEQLEEEALRATEVQTILFYDPREHLSLGPIQWRKRSLVEFIADGKIIERVELGETDLTNPNTIANILKWGKKRAPAHSYLFYFWSHQMAPLNSVARFFGTFDDSHPNADFSTQTLRQSFIQAGFDGVKQKFKAVILSNCYGSNLQNLFQLGDLTEYFLGAGFRLLYDAGLSRQFITRIKGDNTKEVLNFIYNQAALAIQRPRLDPFAKDVPKQNSYPFLLDTENLNALKTQWAKFIVIASENYHWMWKAFTKRSFTWLDLNRFLKNWRGFFRDQILQMDDPVARMGLDAVLEIQRLLASMLLMPEYNQDALGMFVYYPALKGASWKERTSVLAAE